MNGLGVTTQPVSRLMAKPALIIDALDETTAVMREVAASMRESLGTFRLPGASTFAFRRKTDPLRLIVDSKATRFDVPAGFFEDGGPGSETTSFLVMNPNECYVRLRGSVTSTYVPVTADTGWLFPPHYIGAFSTQYPKSMSTLAVATPGITLPKTFAPLELIYGAGIA